TKSERKCRDRELPSNGFEADLTLWGRLRSRPEPCGRGTVAATKKVRSALLIFQRCQSLRQKVGRSTKSERKCRDRELPSNGFEVDLTPLWRASKPTRTMRARHYSALQPQGRSIVCRNLTSLRVHDHEPDLPGDLQFGQRIRQSL